MKFARALAGLVGVLALSACNKTLTYADPSEVSADEFEKTYDRKPEVIYGGAHKGKIAIKESDRRTALEKRAAALDQGGFEAAAKPKQLDLSFLEAPGSATSNVVKDAARKVDTAGSAAPAVDLPPPPGGGLDLSILEGGQYVTPKPSSFWAQVKLKAAELLIHSAQAVEKASTALFGKKDLKQAVGNDKLALEFVKALDSAKLFHARVGGQEAYLVEMKNPSGKTLKMVVDKNWKRACNLADKTFPTTQKLSLKVVNAATKAKSSVEHPFGGKSCSEGALKDYFVYNFDEGSVFHSSGVPSITLLVSKNSAKVYSMYHQNGPDNPGASSLFSTLKTWFAEPLKTAQK